MTAEQVRAQLSAEWRALLDESLPARLQGTGRAEELKQPLGVTSGAAGLDFWVRARFQRPLLALPAISGFQQDRKPAVRKRGARDST